MIRPKPLNDVQFCRIIRTSTKAIVEQSQIMGRTESNQ